VARITGIGGVFLTAHDAEALKRWYVEVLGAPVEDGRIVFRSPGAAILGVFTEEDVEHPLINLRVDDLAAMLEQLGEDVEIEDTENGRFATVVDPEGNPVQLWEPAPGW
jgi:predicted enzyme related to lactoylglutathione lyase